MGLFVLFCSETYSQLFCWEAPLAIQQCVTFYFTEEEYYVCFSDSSNISTPSYELMNYLFRSLLRRKKAKILHVLLLINPNILCYIFINSCNSKTLPCFQLYFPLLLFFTRVSHRQCFAEALTCELDSAFQK